MTMLRIALIAAAALGVTWAAEQAVQRMAQAPAPVMAQADPAPAGQAPDPDAGGTGDAAPAKPGPLPELSSEDVEKELARIEAEVSGEGADDLEEFTPTKPLAADLAIALPSDI
jgi:hypothetical protein